MNICFTSSIKIFSCAGELNEAQLDQMAGGMLVGSERSELWKGTCRACGKVMIVSFRPTVCKGCGSANNSVVKNTY